MSEEQAQEEEDKKKAEKKAAEEKKEEEEKEAAEKKRKEEEEEAASPISEAKEIVKKMEAANKIMTENIKKAEKVAAEMMLGGKTPAGMADKTQEQKEIEDARKLIEGTGFDDLLFPKK